MTFRGRLSAILFWAALGMGQPGHADEDEGYVRLCLKAWGEHPFPGVPAYRKYSSIVNVFGIGQNTDDLGPTRKPSLILIDTGINVMGGATIRLMNPNGWYCLRSNINVMGKVTIKAHCKAHIASASEGLTFLGEDQHNKSTTIMGLTQVELFGCEEPEVEEPRSDNPPARVPKARKSRQRPIEEEAQEDY
jgi:hypothetical protein